MNRLYVLVFLLSVFLVFTTCRKEDVTPHYDYIGGAGYPTTEEEAELEGGIRGEVEEPEFEEARSADEVRYTLANMDDCYISLDGQMVVRGFIESKSDLDNKFSQWCPNAEVPYIEFNKQFAAYYSESVAGCVDVSLKGVFKEGDGTRIDIIRATPPSNCICQMNLWHFQIFLIIDRMDTVAHRFNEIAVEKPCD